MTKAEERALERFPVHEGASAEWIKHHLSSGDCAAYIEGYEQAYQDLGDIAYNSGFTNGYQIAQNSILTCDFIKYVVKTADSLVTKTVKDGENLINRYPTEQSYYEELLNEVRTKWKI